MHIITMQLLLKCETNDHLVALVEYFDLKLHSAKRMANRMKLYFEPTHEGDNIDCVSFPLELFNEDSYMPGISWFNLLRGTK